MHSLAMITCVMFEQERRSVRVVMGYLLGFAIMGYWTGGFLRYVADTGEPVNILETFCVVGQHYVNVLFLILGWLLVAADAPFMKGNIWLLLHRCGRKNWNMGMILYILSQALFYTTAMAAFTVIASVFWGYAGNMWSSPVYALANDAGNHIGVRYNISFPWINMMASMTVPQAFALTFVSLYLYLAFLGVLLYSVSLMFSGIAGIAAVTGVHLIGYLQMMGGNVKYSLFARAVSGNFADGTYWSSIALFVILITSVIISSFIFVNKISFNDRTGADG